MKLKEFIAPKRVVGRESIILSKAGQIRFNKGLSDKLGLKEGSTLAFFEDEEESGDWYIKPNSTAGFALRKDASSSLLFNSKCLSDAIKSSVNKSASSKVVIPVGGSIESPDGSLIFALITNAAK